MGQLVKVQRYDEDNGGKWVEATVDWVGASQFAYVAQRSGRARPIRDIILFASTDWEYLS